MAGFCHPIGELIVSSLVQGKKSKYALDEAGVLKVLDAVQEAIPTPDASKACTALLEVVGFLENADGLEAAAVVMDIFLVIGTLAAEQGVEIAGYADQVEAAGTRKKSASLIGRESSSTAPKAGEEKPAGSISVQDLMAGRRRL